LKNPKRTPVELRHGLFGFRNRINFLALKSRIGEKLLATEGGVWLRKTARAAAVADILLALWTSAVSPKVLHLSV
jgi:hypothetical protein